MYLTVKTYILSISFLLAPLSFGQDLSELLCNQEPITPLQNCYKTEKSEVQNFADNIEDLSKCGGEEGFAGDLAALMAGDLSGEGGRDLGSIAEDKGTDLISKQTKADCECSKSKKDPLCYKKGLQEKIAAIALPFDRARVNKIIEQTDEIRSLEEIYSDKGLVCITSEKELFEKSGCLGGEFHKMKESCKAYEGGGSGIQHQICEEFAEKGMSAYFNHLKSEEGRGTSFKVELNTNAQKFISQYAETQGVSRKRKRFYRDTSKNSHLRNTLDKLGVDPKKEISEFLTDVREQKSLKKGLAKYLGTSEKIDKHLQELPFFPMQNSNDNSKLSKIEEKLNFLKIALAMNPALNPFLFNGREKESYHPSFVENKSSALRGLLDKYANLNQGDEVFSLNRLAHEQQMGGFEKKCESYKKNLGDFCKANTPNKGEYFNDFIENFAKNYSLDKKEDSQQLLLSSEGYMDSQTLSIQEFDNFKAAINKLYCPLLNYKEKVVNGIDLKQDGPLVALTFPSDFPPAERNPNVIDDGNKAGAEIDEVSRELEARGDNPKVREKLFAQYKAIRGPEGMTFPGNIDNFHTMLPAAMAQISDWAIGTADKALSKAEEAAKAYEDALKRGAPKEELDRLGKALENSLKDYKELEKSGITKVAEEARRKYNDIVDRLSKKRKDLAQYKIDDRTPITSNKARTKSRSTSSVSTPQGSRPAFDNSFAPVSGGGQSVAAVSSPATSGGTNSQSPASPGASRSPSSLSSLGLGADVFAFNSSPEERPQYLVQEEGKPGTRNVEIVGDKVNIYTLTDDQKVLLTFQSIPIKELLQDGVSQDYFDKYKPKDLAVSPQLEETIEEASLPQDVIVYIRETFGSSESLSPGSGAKPYDVKTRDQIIHKAIRAP